MYFNGKSVCLIFRIIKFNKEEEKYKGLVYLVWDIYRVIRFLEIDSSMGVV